MTNPFSGCHILLVEDEMIVAWMLEAMLADLGFAVVGPAVRVERVIYVDTYKRVLLQLIKIL
jgi:CheY-like chemotaxis protein